MNKKNILIFVYLILFPSIIKSQYATFDMYTVFPTTTDDSNKCTLKNIENNQDIYIKIYARDVANLVLWKIYFAFDTSKIRWQSIGSNYGFLTEKTGERNILLKSNSSLIFSSFYNNYIATANVCSCAAMVFKSGGISDADAADGNGLMCILHFKTTDQFTKNDTATIQPTLVSFSNNTAGNPFLPQTIYYGAINYDNPLVPVPIDLISFKSLVFDNNVLLNWTTSNEVNNFGFYIERKKGNEEFKNIGFVQGRGNNALEQIYNFKDETIHESGIYYYRLKQVDFDGKSTYSDIIKVTIEFPKSFNLYQNYPNPFNPETTIRYDVNEKDFITIKVYSIEGKEVTALVKENKDPGSYEVRFNAGRYASGTYFYVLQGEHSKIVKKMMVVK